MDRHISLEGERALLERLGQQPAAGSRHNKAGTIWVARSLVGVVLVWFAKTVLWLTGLFFVLGWFFSGSVLWTFGALLATYFKALRLVLRRVVPSWLQQPGMPEFALLMVILVIATLLLLAVWRRVSNP